MRNFSQDLFIDFFKSIEFLISKASLKIYYKLSLVYFDIYKEVERPNIIEDLDKIENLGIEKDLDRIEDFCKEEGFF